MHSKHNTPNSQREHKVVGLGTWGPTKEVDFAKTIVLNPGGTIKPW
jgi:hypothetical protein